MHFLKTTAVALGAVGLLAAPAQARDTALGSCTPAGEMSQAFLPFGDAGLYTPVVNAGLEDETNGWALTGDAAVTDGNEPWFVTGDTADNHSLDVPAGSSATSTPLCVDETYTHFRFFVRGAGKVRVEALFTDARGKVTVDKIEDVKGGSEWAPTGALPIEVIKKAGMTTVPVTFRFT